MFRVINTAPALVQFKILQQLAFKTRSSSKFLRAMSEMIAALENNPEDLGESRELDPIGGFFKRIAFFPPLCVQYAIHPVGKLVLIIRLTPSEW